MRPVYKANTCIGRVLRVIRAGATVLVILMLSTALSAAAQVPAATETNVTEVSPSDEVRTPLAESERHKARAWELTETEWRRYRQLMLGIRGSVSDVNLSPIEVLGIHARDAAERRHYARLWAKAMRADAERVLAFQRAYDVAAEQLFAGIPLIDAGRLKTVPQPTSALQPGDRVLFFTMIECPACEAILAKLLSHLNTVAGIDIYFTDLVEGHEARIRSWAGQQRIEPDWVQRRRVTLNVDNGLLGSISAESSNAPVLFVRRDNAIAGLSYADL